VALCSLRFASKNAPSKQKILDTVLLSILAGHKRYAHITSVRADNELPELLGIDGIVSEDSVHRAFLHASNEDLTMWLDRCMNTVFEPLLKTAWILDVDAAVKTLYGTQEEASVGYNLVKPGRLSHVHHACCFARVQMLLNIVVQAGNQTQGTACDTSRPCGPTGARAQVFARLGLRARRIARTGSTPII